MRVPIVPFKKGRVAILPEEGSHVVFDREGEVILDEKTGDIPKKKGDFRVVTVNEDGEIVPDDTGNDVSKPYEQVALEMCVSSGFEWIGALKTFLSNEIQMLSGEEFLLYLNLLLWGMLISNQGTAFFSESMAVNKKKQT